MRVKFESEQPLSNTTQNLSIYVVGGRLRGKTLKSVERFSISRNVWESCPSMIENRGSHASVALNGKLYVVGGGGLHSNLSGCEVLDLSSGIWSNIAVMNTCRHALTVTTFIPPPSSSFSLTSSSLAASQTISSPPKPLTSTPYPSLFAIGGWVDGSIGSAHIERYDPALDTWTLLSPMNFPRRLLAATQFEDSIYVFGGLEEDGIWYSNILEIYHVSTDSWTLGSPMPHRGAASAVTVGALIYLFIHGKGLFAFDPHTGVYEERTGTGTGAGAGAGADDGGAKEEVKEDQRFGGLPIKDWYCFSVVAGNDAYHDNLLPPFPLPSPSYSSSSSSFSSSSSSSFSIPPTSPSDVLSPSTPTSTSTITSASINNIQENLEIPRPEASPVDVLHIVDSPPQFPHHHHYYHHQIRSSKIYVFGGVTGEALGGSRWLRSVFEYDIFQDAWTPLAPMLKQRRRCSAAIVCI